MCVVKNTDKERALVLLFQQTIEGKVEQFIESRHFNT
jgi:hypothetical protein